ncbi:MAG: FtsX-like permease family protein [Cellulosilyticaceae bacterium]
MHKSTMIPKLALTALFKNKRAYMPYMLITSFAVFVFFIFNAISLNEVMEQVPHTMYIQMFMMIGQVLLAIILIPILFTTNEFLVKQRKSELGLYNVLGLDRKEIAIMMVYETGIIYVITLGVGLLCATFFSKLVYLFLINVMKLPVDIPFEGKLISYGITIVFFAIVAGVNLATNLYQVMKAKPIDLMKASKKGEKQIRFLGLKTVVGIFTLGIGYWIGVKTQIDSMIFINFFMAVMLVIVGTRMLFEAGSISLLSKMKRMPKFYYKKENFITISGMLYRMKRNAQNLSSICIFCTMIMVTLICTVAVFNGKDEAFMFEYPLDLQYTFEKPQFEGAKAFESKIQEIADSQHVVIQDKIQFHYQGLNVLQEENAFVINKDTPYASNAYGIRVMNVEEYNVVEGRNVVLEADEALVFSSATDFGYEILQLGETTYKVKEELQSLKFESKDDKNTMGHIYYVVLPTQQQVEATAQAMEQFKDDKQKYTVRFDVVGEQKDREAFTKALSESVMISHSRRDGILFEQINDAMMGGLLFLGLFFGVIFTVCMLLIMYYKQVSEGYEDQKNYKVLKQVGMSDEEVNKTIRKQILMVFFLPLVVAVTHTFVALQVIEGLLTVLWIYNHQMILWSSYGVVACFAVIYSISYIMTSRAYYKIIK